jgi:predicted DNA-binding protein
METKLTIKISDDLRRRAKARAAREGTTLSQVIRERLEEFAAGWDVTEEADDVRAVDEIEARIARGEERLRDWAEVDAELDALPDQNH